MRRRARVVRGGPHIPKRPYRDSILVYAACAAVVVLVAVLTNGSLVRAVIVAAFFFVAATSWSWMHWRRKIRERDRLEAVERKMRAS